MIRLDTKAELQDRIIALRQQQNVDLVALRQQYSTTIESFKPMNMIKSATLEFINAPSLKSDLINGALGFGTSYLTSKVLNENSQNPAMRLFSKVLKFAMKNFIGKKSTKI